MKVFTDQEGNDYRSTDIPPRRGGLAEIYAAIAPDGREVAVKVFREQTHLASVERAMLSEIRAVDPRAEDWLVALLGHGTWEGRPFLALPWMHASLADWLPSHSLRERLVVLELAAGAVARLHSTQTATADYRVHRDIKPANLRVAEQGGVWVVRLADLGLTRRGVGADEPEITGPMTRHFAPTEQMLPLGGPPSASWDVYALGVVIYFGITDRLPQASFQARSLVNDLGITLTELAAQSERGIPLSSRDQARLDDLLQRPPESFLDLRRGPAWRSDDQSQLTAALAAGADRAKPEVVSQAAARLSLALARALETDPRKRESSARPLVAALREVRGALFSKGDIILASAEPVLEGAVVEREAAPDRPWKIALLVLLVLWLVVLVWGGTKWLW